MDVKRKYEINFESCMSIMQKYGLDTASIKNDLNQIPTFKVTTPIIGGFSTGKSSMINAILGTKLLSVNITPETSIPTELFYGHDSVALINGDDKEIVSVDEFKKMDLSIDKIKLIKIGYEHQFLNKIKDVVIVDMPGFDSGIALHNEAIDKYLPKSLAYIITFSADDPTVKESIVNFLKELKLYDMPVYIVITKCDKVTENQLHNDIVLHIKKSVQNLLNINDVKIACVKSKRDKNTVEVEEFLFEIQQKSEEIFEKEYSNRIKKYITELENYINSRLKNNDLSIEDLDCRQKELEENLRKIKQQLSREEESFNRQLEQCINVIGRRIESELSAASSSLESAVLNGNDINDRVNMIVRNAVMTGIKTEFEPKFQKYLRHIASIINVNSMVDTNIELNQMDIAVDNVVKDVALKAIPVVIAAIGGVLAGPLGAVVGGLLSTIVETLFVQKQDDKKRSIARERVQEAIGQISSDTISQVRSQLHSYVRDVNEEIRADVEKQIEITNKAIEDIKIEKRSKEAEREAQVRDLKDDLEKIGGILNEIR